MMIGNSFGSTAVGACWWIWMTMLVWLPRGVEGIDNSTEVQVAAASPASSIVPPHLVADFPTNITLRGGVLHAPPFAIVQEDADSATTEGETRYRYGGLQPDLLERLKIFAAADGVVLNFDLSPSPPVWDDALDLVAHDCEETLTEYYAAAATVGDNGDQSAVAKLQEDDDKYRGNDCNTFDIIVGEYTSTPERYQRADFTPPFLQSAIGALKYVGEEDDALSTKQEEQPKQMAATLTQADRMGATICGQAGSFTMRAVQARFPNAQYLLCQSQTECFDHLMEGRCDLLTRDKLSLKGKTFEDPRFEVTPEEFNTYYLVWPMKYDLPPVISYLMKRWVLRAVRNGTLDELYHKYFEKDLCPLGQAGPNCELPCDAEHGLADARGRCICESVKWSGDDCSIEIEEDINLIPSSLKILAYSMFAVNVAVILACGGWLITHWNSEEVRASQPSFLLLVLCGCLISSSTIIAMAQEGEGDGPVPACAAIPWLYSVGFCVTFGTLFAKIRRVHLMFRQAANEHQQRSNTTIASNGDGSSLHNGVGVRRIQARKKSLQVSFQETLLVIGAVLMVDVAILVAWSLVDQLHWERTIVSETQFGEPLESQGYCISDHWKIFFGIIGALHLALMATATYLCYKARSIPTRFQEGKYLSIAMASNFQIFLVGVPILIIVGSDPQSGFFVRATMVWMNDLAVVAIIFGNLMFRTKLVDFSKSVLQRQMTKAVLQYSPGAGSRDSKESTPSDDNVPQFLTDELNQGQERVQRETYNSSLSSPESPERATAMAMQEPELSEPSRESNRLPNPTFPRDDMISSLSMSSEFQVGIATSIPGRMSSLTMSSNRKNSNRSVSFAPIQEDEDVSVPLGVPLSTKEKISEEADDKNRRLSWDESVLRFSVADCHGEPPKPPMRKTPGLEVNDVEKSTQAKESEMSTCGNDMSPQRPTRVLSSVDPPNLDTLGAGFLEDDCKPNNPGKCSFGKNDQISELSLKPDVLLLQTHDGSRWIDHSGGGDRHRTKQAIQGAPERPKRLASEATDLGADDMSDSPPPTYTTRAA